MKKTLLLAGLLAAPTLTGCFRGGANAAFLGLVGIDIAAHVAAANAEPRVIVVTPAPPPPYPPPPPPYAPPPTIIPNDFDAADARAALSHVDPSRCWGPGSQAGYATLHVAFAPQGYVHTVSIESIPPGPPPIRSASRTCFARRPSRRLRGRATST